MNQPYSRRVHVVAEVSSYGPTVIEKSGSPLSGWTTDQWRSNRIQIERLWVLKRNFIDDNSLRVVAERLAQQFEVPAKTHPWLFPRGKFEPQRALDEPYSFDDRGLILADLPAIARWLEGEASAPRREQAGEEEA